MSSHPTPPRLTSDRILDILHVLSLFTLAKVIVSQLSRNSYQHSSNCITTKYFKFQFCNVSTCRQLYETLTDNTLYQLMDLSSKLFQCRPRVVFVCVTCCQCNEHNGQVSQPSQQLNSFPSPHNIASGPAPPPPLLHGHRSIQSCSGLSLTTSHCNVVNEIKGSP